MRGYGGQGYGGYPQPEYGGYPQPEYGGYSDNGYKPGMLAVDSILES